MEIRPLRVVSSATLVIVAAASCTPFNPSTATALRTPPTAPPAATASTLVVGGTLISATDGARMVAVPPGEFTMGSKIGLTDEQPVHLITLDAFWIDRTEVTNSTYALCVQSGTCGTPSATIYYGDGAYADHPVVFVSWEDARAYCAWADRRLPTEAEWEKAASWDAVASEKRIYPWGNDFDCKRGNFDDETQLDSFVVPGGPSCDGYDRTSPVGSFPSGASPYGALDMGGNVWEWVYDGFIETDPFSDNKTYYAISPSSNPTGPESSAYRVMRGGSWNLNFGFGRTAYRLWFGPDDSYDGVGFRCARSQ